MDRPWIYSLFWNSPKSTMLAAIVEDPNVTSSIPPLPASPNRDPPSPGWSTAATLLGVGGVGLVLFVMWQIHGCCGSFFPSEAEREANRAERARHGLVDSEQRLIRSGE